jgi:hypothetical protein
MKKLLLLGCSLFMLSLAMFAQIGNVTMLTFPGVPSGKCQNTQLGLNRANGNLYSCNNGAWATSSGGSGTVTSVATTAPITGGTITTSGTLACATCVVASSPGVGLAHFAGSTQTATSSAVNLASADVTGLLPTTNGGTSTIYLTSAYTNATTSYTNVTDGTNNLAFAVAANTNYSMTCSLYYQSSATTAQMDLQLTGPASPTAVAYFGIMVTNQNGTGGFTAATAFSSTMGTAAAQQVTTNLPTLITMGLVNGANAGTVQVQVKSHGVGTVTIQPASHCTLTP